MQDNNILEISRLSKSFPGVKALEEVDMDVKEGEVHALLGENGSGKSTLTKCIVGAYHKDSGDIHFDGKQVNFSSPAESFKSGITVIYQERSLIPKLTVEQNVFLGGEVVNNGVLDKKEMRKKYNSLCETFGFDLLPNLKINRLGVAQQKVVEIMKALARKSKLVIMDEPTASLSKQEAEHLFEIIQRLKKKNISILYITHILEEVFQITDRITVLRDGKKISTLKTDETNQDEIVDLMVGEVLDEKVFLTSHAKYEAEPIISVKNFVNKPRVNNISFDVYEGEVLGITGLTGAGKTELARAMFGADTVENGTLTINGDKAKLKSPTDAIRSGIALVPEDRKTDGLVLLFEVFKNITLPAIEEFSNELSVLNKKKELEKTNQFKNRLNIRLSSEYQQTKFLSGGNQQKVVIAKWLLTNPRLLILDEATQGIDVKAKREIYLIVRELAKTGVAIIFISSEVQDIYRVSDRIIVLRNGQITGEFKRGAPQEEILKNVVGGKPTLDD
ncbi:MAG: sugar ABC transporter ATP-binding protein [Kosmotogaceae bacterium]